MFGRRDGVRLERPWVRGVNYEMYGNWPAPLFLSENARLALEFVPRFGDTQEI